MASWNVFGMSSYGIPPLRMATLLFFVTHICCLPHRWLKATYRSVSPFVSKIRRQRFDFAKIKNSARKRRNISSSAGRSFMSLVTLFTPIGDKINALMRVRRFRHWKKMSDLQTIRQLGRAKKLQVWSNQNGIVSTGFDVICISLKIRRKPPFLCDG